MPEEASVEGGAICAIVEVERPGSVPEHLTSGADRTDYDKTNGNSWCK